MDLVNLKWGLHITVLKWTIVLILKSLERSFEKKSKKKINNGNWTTKTLKDKLLKIVIISHRRGWYNNKKVI